MSTQEHNKWKFILCESPAPGSALGTGYTKITELSQARGKQLDLGLNRAGSFSFSYPIMDEWAPYIQPRTTCVVAVQNGVIRWSGPVWTIRGSLPDGTLNVACVGWMELLTQRELREQKVYGSINPDTGVAWTDAEIVFDLLETVRATEPEYAPPIYVGTATGDRQVRSKTWEKGTRIEAAIRELSEVEAGIDFEIDPATRELNVHAWDEFKSKTTEVHYGYKWGPSNIASLSWDVDGSSVRNHIVVTGKGVGPVVAPEPGSKSKYGVSEETIALTDVGEIDILFAFAAAETEVRHQPIVIYNISPFPYRDMGNLNQTNIPRLFYDFQLGDRLYFSAREGWLKINKQAVRVFGVSIQIDEVGDEKMTNFQISPNG